MVLIIGKTLNFVQFQSIYVTFWTLFCNCTCISFIVLEANLIQREIINCTFISINQNVEN